MATRPDAIGVCGGSCTADVDGDGICDDVDPCVGTVDACGVCEGPGAIYECGCNDIPAGDCDCDGNQLDALNVCGGTCAADADADGICDDVDPCVGQSWTSVAVCNGPGDGAANAAAVTSLRETATVTATKLDALGECGGTCAADVDSDGICDDVDTCIRHLRCLRHLQWSRRTSMPAVVPRSQRETATAMATRLDALGVVRRLLRGRCRQRWHL